MISEDRVLPFQTETGPWRGRLVRLGPLLDEILGRHDYPAPVAGLVAEATALAVTLASALKYDGVFTLQIKGDGPVGMLVADVLSPPAGDDDSGARPRVVRAQARHDTAALQALAATGAGLATPVLTGAGWLAFTVDPGENTDRYQGIVALEGESLAEAAVHYFQQSEQLPTALRVAVGQTGDGRGGVWRAGALMLQPLPAGRGESHAADSVTEDDWRRAMVLMSTLTGAELLDPALSDNDLLYRLFHQDTPRVYPAQPLAFGCRCSRDRVARVLASLPADERTDLAAAGSAEIRCEFCATTYHFTAAELEP